MKSGMTAILPAAGESNRMGYLPKDISKVLMPFANGKCALEIILITLAQSKICDSVVIPCRASEQDLVASIIAGMHTGFKAKVITGGSTRQESVRRALAELPEACDMVMVHDSARPFCSAQLFKKVNDMARITGAAVAGLPVVDALKRVHPGTQMIAHTLNRENVWLTHTPQIFRRNDLERSHSKALADNYIGVDECELVQRINIEISYVLSTRENIKITAPEDMHLSEILAEKYLETS